MSEEVFLGVVDKNGNIFIPWRGTHVYVEHDYEADTNLLVTLDTEHAFGQVAKVELPTLKQIKAMKEEFAFDWERFSSVFKHAPMRLQVLMLHALNRVMGFETKEYSGSIRKSISQEISNLEVTK